MTPRVRNSAPACLLAVLYLVAACGPAGDEPAGDGPPATGTSRFAEAEIGAVGDGDARGELRFDQDAEFLRFSGYIAGLQPGRYLLHIHEGRDCAASPEGFAGPIFSLDPDSPDLALDPELPNAAGNLGEFLVDDGGEAAFDSVEVSLSLGDAAHSVMNRSIVVHRGRGDEDVPVIRPGEAVACGPIEPIPTPGYVR